MATMLQLLGENFCLVTFVLAFVIATLNTIARRGTPHGNFAEQLFRWFSLLAIGFTGIFTFAGHVFAPDVTARNIGWEPSPFQYEAGMADLTIGVLGIMAFRRNLGFRLATTIATVCWLGGDAIGHVQQMIVADNFAPGNAGPWFWCDVLNPIIMVTAYYFSSRALIAESRVAPAV